MTDAPLPFEVQARQKLAELMGETYLADDLETSEGGLTDIREAHDWLHTLIQLTEMREGDSSPNFMRMLTLHVAIEYLEFLSMDHIARLQKEKETT